MAMIAAIDAEPVLTNSLEIVRAGAKNNAPLTGMPKEKLGNTKTNAKEI